MAGELIRRSTGLLLIGIMAILMTPVSGIAQDSNSISLDISYAVDLQNPYYQKAVDYLETYFQHFSTAMEPGDLDSFWQQPAIQVQSPYDLGLAFLTRPGKPSIFFETYEPYLLDIIPVADSLYKAMVLFSVRDGQPVDPGNRARVKAISEYHVQFKDGQMKFINTLDLLLPEAESVRVENVTYYFWDTASFDMGDALKTKALTDTFRDYFPNDIRDTFRFIICKDQAMLARCFNFITSYTVKTNGTANNSDRYLVSALNTAYYGHETIHALSPDYIGFLWEGIATYFGGSNNQHYTEFIAADDRLDDRVFSEIFSSGEIQWYYHYAFGSLLCEFIFTRLEIESYEQFFQAFNTFPEFLNYLESGYAITPDELKETLQGMYAKHQSR